MSLIQVQTDLSTAEGFARRVVVARPAVSIAKGLLAVAGFALAYNLFSTFRTWTEHPGLDFFKIFLSTSGDNPASSLWFTLLVWGPIVVIPLAAVFFFYARSTAQKVDHAAYLEFAATGYVVTQRPIGFAAVTGNGSSTQQFQVQLLSHASVTPEAYEKALSEIAAHIATLDKKEAKKLARALGGVQAAPRPAHELVSTLSPQLILSGPTGKTEWVAVLPSSAADGKTRYLAVKP